MQADFLVAMARIAVNHLVPFLAVAGRFWSLKRTPKGSPPDIVWRGVFVVLAVFYAVAFFWSLFGWESLAWLSPPHRRGGPAAGLVISVIMACLSARRFRAELAAEQVSR